MALSDEEFDSLGFTFVWRIENFGHCLDGNDVELKSPDFYVNLLGKKTVWNLFVVPRYFSRDVNYIRYLLKKDYPRHYEEIVDFELAILASDGSIINCTEMTRKDANSYCLYGKLIDKEELFGKRKDFYLPRSTLTLQLRMWESDNVRSWLGQGFARTRISVRKMSIIREFYIENGCHIEIEHELKEKVSLKFYFNKSVKCDEKLQMEISETDSSQENLICFKIALLNSSGGLVHLCTGDYLFQKGEGKQTKVFAIPLLKSTLSLNRNLYSDSWRYLKMKCDFTLSTGVVYSELEITDVGPGIEPYVNSFIPEIHQPRHKAENVNPKIPKSLTTDLLNLYTEGADCDFELISGSSNFPVHKMILVARSPVFRSMLSSDMIEKNTNVVDIPDLDSDTVKRMLHFLYTDAIEVVEWDAMTKLYFAADKYGIESLKKKCSSFLERNICAANVCEVLELGDLHQGHDLKDAAMTFVLRNDDEILSSVEWIQFSKRNGIHWPLMCYSGCI